MNRIAIVCAVVFAIVWQSGCLTHNDWIIYSRCGLWPWLSDHPLIVSLDGLPTRTVEKVVEKTKIVKERVEVPSEPKIVYVPQTQAPATYGAPISTCTAMPTSTTTSTMIYSGSTTGMVCSTTTGTITTTPYTMGYPYR